MHYIYSNPLKYIIYEDCYTILYNTGDSTHGWI